MRYYFLLLTCLFIYLLPSCSPKESPYSHENVKGFWMMTTDTLERFFSFEDSVCSYEPYNEYPRYFIIGDTLCINEIEEESYFNGERKVYGGELIFKFILHEVLPDTLVLITASEATKENFFYYKQNIDTFKLIRIQPNNNIDIQSISFDSQNGFYQQTELLKVDNQRNFFMHRRGYFLNENTRLGSYKGQLDLIQYSYLLEHIHLLDTDSVLPYYENDEYSMSKSSIRIETKDTTYQISTNDSRRFPLIIKELIHRLFQYEDRVKLSADATVIEELMRED